MIQRIQSIFLLLLAVSIGLLFVWPIATSSQKDAYLFADGQYSVEDNTVLMLLTALCAVLAIGAIFLFRNRGLQLRMTYLATVCSILIPLVAILIYLNDTKNSAVPANTIDDQVGAYLPVLGLIFGVLASRFIRKDEKLVKSMDRLR
ncbi:MAG: DUF4293 domain-containing protein [Saprospiraceae bacterium]|nr:DUF4293 domain-containing protein [Saprospiraceae bacterium]